MLRHMHALIRTSLISSRLYYTKSSKPKKKGSSLYSIISPLGNPNVSVTPELNKWVETGHKVRFAELQRIIVDLRRRKRFAQALQVSEWTKSRGTYTFTPVQHAVQLDLIGKVHGSVSAESYFHSLPEQDKTDKVYGALLHCYVRQHQIDKTLSHLEEMKEKGLALSSVAFNDIMSLYTNIGEPEKVPEVLTRMKETGVQPDNLSYRICINSFGVRSDIEGVEKILSEMENDKRVVMDWNTYAVVANFYVKSGLKTEANIALEKAEGQLDNKDGLGYNHHISLHARLGNRDDVFRLWGLEKNACKRCLNRDYVNMLESLARLGELEEAEKVLKEWESSGNCYDLRVPSVVIVGYIEKGVCEKAESLLKSLLGTGKSSTPNIWGKLAAGYLEKGEVAKAVESLKIALSISEANKDGKFDDKIITKILRLVGKNGSFSFGDVENVVTLLKSVVPLKRKMYHALLESYHAGGKEVGRILDLMKADGYGEDEVTSGILSAKADGYGEDERDGDSGNLVNHGEDEVTSRILSAKEE